MAWNQDAVMLNLTQFAARTSAVAACLMGALAWPMSISAGEKDIVINEIMYHPPLEMEDLQYVELFNRGSSSVDLSDWSFSKGIKFTFPKQTRIEPGEYLVVCRDAKLFAGNYGRQIRAIGDFSGRLSHRGEKIELSNAAGVRVDAVKYSDTEPWPTGPDGHSTSLERICPDGPSDDPANWAGSAMPPFEKPAGSPGRRNDSFSPAPAPLISEVTFKTPAPEAEATVKARISDSAGVKSASLLW